MNDVKQRGCDPAPASAFTNREGKPGVAVIAAGRDEGRVVAVQGFELLGTATQANRAPVANAKVEHGQRGEQRDGHHVGAKGELDVDQWDLDAAAFVAGEEVDVADGGQGGEAVGGDRDVDDHLGAGDLGGFVDPLAEVVVGGEAGGRVRGCERPEEAVDQQWGAWGSRWWLLLGVGPVARGCRAESGEQLGWVPAAAISGGSAHRLRVRWLW